MKKKLPITPTAALAIVLIVITEAVFLATTEPLTGLPLFQPTVDDATLVAKREIMRRAPGQILLVGDSSCLMGLDPDSVASPSLGTPVNLGSLVSFTLPGFATLATEAMAGHPKALVISVLPRSFEVTEAEAHSYNLLGRYLVAYNDQSPEYAPSLDDRWSWFVRKHRFNIYPPEWGGSFEGYKAQLKAMSGHYVEHGTYRGPHPGEFRSSFSPTDYSRRGFVEMAEAARRLGLPVVMWWSPSPNDAVSSDYLAAASHFVDELAEDIPNLHVARPAPAWDPRLFGSITHLTPEAAKQNSRELRAYLTTNLPSLTQPLVASAGTVGQ